MQLLDITKFDSDFDYISKAKSIIEDMWIENKIIKEHLSFSEFMKKINVAKYILMITEENAIPFNFVKTKDNAYVFYCGTYSESLNEESFKYLANVLSKTKYDLNILTEVTDRDLALEERYIPEPPYFVISGKNYIYKE